VENVRTTIVAIGLLVAFASLGAAVSATHCQGATTDAVACQARDAVQTVDAQLPDGVDQDESLTGCQVADYRLFSTVDVEPDSQCLTSRCQQFGGGEARSAGVFVDGEGVEVATPEGDGSHPRWVL
jgi:hypothetical protein